MTAYATVQDLRLRLQIDDSQNDAELSDKLDTASRQIEQDTGRVFTLDAAASARTLNPAGRVVRTREGDKLLIDDIGDTAGLIVEVGQGTSYVALTATDDYETGPDNALAMGEPIEWLLRLWRPWIWWPRQRVRVTAKWGWPSVPAPIKEATLLRAARLFRRRNSPEGVAGFGDMGPIRVSRTDPDYDALIYPYVQPGFGGPG